MVSTDGVLPGPATALSRSRTVPAPEERCWPRQDWRQEMPDDPCAVLSPKEEGIVKAGPLVDF